MPRDLAIDLGTETTLVFAPAEGIVWNQPSVAAVDHSGSVLALGLEAKDLATSRDDVQICRPLGAGSISNYEILRKTVKLLLRNAGVSRFARSRLILCVPSTASTVERRALAGAARRAGARHVRLLDQPLAAAVGAGLPVHEAVGTMIVNIGATATEAALLSLGGIVVEKSLRVGSAAFDKAIANWLRREHRLVVDDRTAEELKIALGSVTSGVSAAIDDSAAEVSGTDLGSGQAREATVTAADLGLAFRDPLSAITETVVACLAGAPPELGRDLLSSGLTLTGGGAQMRGLSVAVGDAAGVPAHLAPGPSACAVLGAGQCLERFDKLSRTHLDSGGEPNRRARALTG